MCLRTVMHSDHHVTKFPQNSGTRFHVFEGSGLLQSGGVFMVAMQATNEQKGLRLASVWASAVRPGVPQWW